ncbi:MAG: hypothetical protein FWC32_09585 [Firmicutes bacterium]|nr:hypothetical protein [Bacillota bacterium]
MKSDKIINSWNKINADDAAHERIMANILENVHSAKVRKTPWKVLAPIAACIAALLLGVWLVPRMGETGRSPIEPHDVVMPGLVPPDSGNASQAAETMPGMPPDVSQIYPLTLNEMNAPIEARIFIPQHFWHDATPEQLRAILPDLGFSVTATVSYYGEYAALFDVSIIETEPYGGEIARFDDVFIRTWMRIGPRPIFSCAIFDFDPVVSYVHGIPVTAGVHDRMSDWAAHVAIYIAYFEINGVFYRIQLYDYAEGDGGVNRLTEIVNTIIVNGPADLSVFADPVVPELQDDRMTIEEARLDPDFGRFLPVYVPEGFTPDEARRVIDQHFNGIFAHWHLMGEMSSISWQVSLAAEHDIANVVSINERQKFDLSLYSVPFAETVPEQYSQFVMNPVFLAEEITLDAVQSRDLYGRGGTRLNFGVLFGDVVVSISVMDVTPEQVWEMLLTIK